MTGPEAREDASDAADRARLNLRGSAVVLVILVALGFLAWFLTTNDSGGSAASSSSGKVIEQYPADKRTTVDSFSAQLLDGSTFDNVDLVGTVTVYNVWGSWCGPCRKEAPVLARVAKEMAADVRFVGINVRDNLQAAQAFERKFNVPYSSIKPSDSGAAILAFRGTLASAAVPSTVILDRDGRVAVRIIGPVTYATFRDLVADVVAEPSGAAGRATVPQARLDGWR